MATGVKRPQLTKSDSCLQYYYIKSKMHGLVMEVKNARVEQKTYIVVSEQQKGAAHQLWCFKDTGESDGFCYIMSKLNNLVLDIRGCNHHRGAYIITFPKNTPPCTIANQRWRIDSDGFIYTQLNGMVLNIKGAKKSSGTYIVMHERKIANAENQQWIFEPAELHSVRGASVDRDSLPPGSEESLVTYVHEKFTFERLAKSVYKRDKTRSDSKKDD